MKRILKACVAGFAGLLAVAGSAQAHENVGITLHLGTPTYYGPPQVYMVPPPVRYAPPAVVYYQPTPVYYGRSTFIGYDQGPRRHFGHHDHGWHRGWQGHHGR